MSRSRQRGFTLIELMTVAAVIGVLSAIALPIYQTYMRNASMAKVSTHYDEAVRYLENECRRIQVGLATGTIPSAMADTQMAQAAVIARLNASGGTAPGGVAAYADTANDVAGVVTVVLTSGLVSTADITFTVTRPAYMDLPAETAVIKWADL